jgi:hypothetical protein
LELYSNIVRQAVTSRSALQQHVYQYAACFQGDGKIAFAIDAPRLAPYMRMEVRADPSVSAAYQDMRDHLAQLVPDRLQVGADKALQWLRVAQTDIEQHAGEDSLKDIVAALERVHNLAKEQGLVERVDLINDKLDKLKFLSTAQLAKVRSSLALILQVQKELLSLLNDAAAFIAQVERKLGTQIETLKDADTTPSVESIQGLLTKLQESVAGLI